MKLSNFVGCTVLTLALGASAQAACGGGGFQPKKNDQSAQSVPASTRMNDNRVVTNANSTYFDVSSFHNVSGQLHLSGEQATSIINAIQDIRRQLNEQPKPAFDPRQEFDKRLATILNPEQMKTYQNSVKRS